MSKFGAEHLKNKDLLGGVCECVWVIVGDCVALWRTGDSSRVYGVVHPTAAAGAAT